MGGAADKKEVGALIITHDATPAGCKHPSNLSSIKNTFFAALIMLTKINYSQCPSCGSVSIGHSMNCVDYTVSKETFEVWRCSNCTFQFTQNVPDALHIGPYYQSEDYVSHSDTKKGVINHLYHLARTITLKSKIRLVQKSTQLRCGNLLDYGAGIGAFANVANQAAWTITGLEPDDTARQKAFKNYGLSLQPSIVLQQLPAASFDAVTLWHVLEHVHDLHATLEQFDRILKPFGRLIIAVPNYTSYDAHNYQQCWAAYDVPRHLYHFSPKAMQVLMEQKGFIVENKYPMWFDSFYVSMLSEKYKTGKNNYLGALLTGVASNMRTLFNTDKCSSVIYVMRKK